MQYRRALSDDLNLDICDQGHDPSDLQKVLARSGPLLKSY